ncbi:MAG: hypothetical protein WDW36_007112 [Sanguina aurantia]
MAKAMTSVRQLTLCVTHERYLEEDAVLPSPLPGLEVQPELLEQRQQPAPAQPQPQQEVSWPPPFNDVPWQMTCPNGLGVVSGCVFAMLATAVPNLQELKLTGCCWDAALYAFGLACPHLTQLDIEALCVPVEALTSFGTHLPHLLHLTVTNHHVCHADKVQLGAYFDAFLPTTQQCVHLTRLEIDLCEGMSLTCQPDTWALIPTDKLQHLRCACYMAESPSFNALIRKVPSLCLEGPPCDDLLKVFRGFPLLRQLEVLSTQSNGDATWLVCDEEGDLAFDMHDADAPGLRMLRDRLLDGSFSLTCNSIGFEGSMGGISGVFDWLPVFPTVGTVEFMFSGDDTPHCLQRLAHLCPGAYEIILDGLADVAEAWSLEVLAPLAALPKLGLLRLRCPQLAVTVDGLMKLCNSLPRMACLTIDTRLCEGVVDRQELAAEVEKLGKLGRRISVGIR